VRSWLLDTGPLVAYLDAGDASHAAVSACLEAFSGRLFTTSAVITEAMHFVSPSPGGPALLVEFLTAGDIAVIDFSQPSELQDAVSLMEKYSDTPMDYADATLVLLAERLRVLEIVTLDRRGFSAYRTRRGEAFTLVLDGWSASDTR
jgi:predicted nucleic acid-binding protein